MKVADNTAPGALQWVLAETMGTAGCGTVVNCALPLVKDQRVIYQCAVHGDVFLKCVDGSDLAAFRGQPSGWDIRILPVVKSATGTPMRSLSSLVASSREDAVDWLCLVPGGLRWPCLLQGPFPLLVDSLLFLCCACLLRCFCLLVESLLLIFLGFLRLLLRLRLGVFWSLLFF